MSIGNSPNGSTTTICRPMCWVLGVKCFSPFSNPSMQAKLGLPFPYLACHLSAKCLSTPKKFNFQRTNITSPFAIAMCLQVQIQCCLVATNFIHEPHSSPFKITLWLFRHHFWIQRELFLKIMEAINMHDFKNVWRKFIKHLRLSNIHKALQLCIFWSFTCLKKTCFMDNMEEKLLTCGSYFPCSLGNSTTWKLPTKLSFCF